VLQLTGVGPLGTGEGQPLPEGGAPQLTGVGPLGTGEGQPLPAGGAPQLTGVGPLGTGDGQPLPAGGAPQLTGVGPLGTGEGQPTCGMSGRVGVAGGVARGTSCGFPETATEAFATQQRVAVLVGY
jgi:hypothetical protein